MLMLMLMFNKKTSTMIVANKRAPNVDDNDRWAVSFPEKTGHANASEPYERSNLNLTNPIQCYAMLRYAMLRYAMLCLCSTKRLQRWLSRTRGPKNWREPAVWGTPAKLSGIKP